MASCLHLSTMAEDGAPSPRLWCDDCGMVLIQPEGWQPASSPRCEWVRRFVQNNPNHLRRELSGSASTKIVSAPTGRH